MGAALKIFLGAELKSGIDTMLDLCDFDALIKDADYVITGEGRLDHQSSDGKAVKKSKESRDTVHGDMRMRWRWL